MAVVVIDTIKPKNQGTFPIVEAADVKVTNDKRLDAALNEKANQSDLTALQTTVSGKASQADLTALSNTVAGKQNTLTTEQLAAANSGITSQLVTQIGTNTTTIAGKADAADLTALSVEVDAKADSTDVDDLQAQIDALVTPVTQDAEVQNARVDEEGTSYTTLKARLDAHDTAAAAEIGTAESNINAVGAKFGFDIIANVSYNSKDCPKTDGTFFTDVYTPQTWFGSGFVKIPAGATAVKYCGAGYNGGNPLTPLAFYDSSKAFISCVPLNSEAGSAVYEGAIAIPNNAVYIYQTKFYSSGSSSNSNNYTKFYFGTQYDLDLMQNAANNIGLDEITYTDSVSDNAYTEEDLYLVDGTTQSFGGGWLSTDFIDVSGRTTVHYVSRSFTNNTTIDLAYVAFFNESKIMISCLKSSDTTNGRHEGTIAVPVGAKYVRSVTDSVIEDPMVQLYATGLTKEINEMYAAYNADKELSEANIICIGDSLTQGVNGNTVLGPITLIKENYPAFLSQALNNSHVQNNARYGATPITYWTTYKDYYPTPTATVDIALIMLGTNGGVSDTLATDVEPYDDYDDYAETSCGCYCKIIEWIKETTNNHAQIILMTPPTCNVDGRPDKYNVVKNSLPAIHHIAERYSLPVIDVFNESGIGTLDNATFRPYDGLHFNSKGYHRIGTFVASQLKSLFATFSLTDTDTEILPYN